MYLSLGNTRQQDSHQGHNQPQLTAVCTDVVWEYNALSTVYFGATNTDLHYSWGGGGGLLGYSHQKVYPIDYKNTEAKSHHLKKLPVNGQVFICLRTTPLLVFCLGWCSTFVGSESGQFLRVLLRAKIMVSNTNQHPPHSLPATYCLNILTIH
jgi:hypothetical protein